MIEDTENQIRNLLNYCDLEFEEDCLNFIKLKEQLESSSEQVRQLYIKKVSVSGNILNLG